MTTVDPPPPPVTGPPPPPDPEPPDDRAAVAASVSAPADDGSLTSGKFWAKTGERMVKTTAQVLVAVLVAKVTGAGGVDIAAIDWPTALGLAVGAAVLSLLMSLASRRIGPDDSPSVI